MKPNRFISIRLRLVLFFAFFVATIISSHFLTRSAFENLGEYQIIINRASQNNEIIEQILNYAKQIAENQRVAVALLNSDIRRFDLNLELLEKGGPVMVEEEKIELPPCVPEVKPLFEELSQLWYYQFRDEAKVFVEQDIFTDTIFESGQKTLTERAELALKNITQNRERLLTANSRLIEKYLEISKQQRDRANLWLWGLLGVNLSLIAIGLYLVQIWVVRPLLQISQVAQSIGEGDLSQKITYYRRNEVGQVAEAINEMVDKIRNATDFIKSIEQGDLSVSYTQTNGQTPEKDALAGALINMRERMKAVALEEEERNWVTEGLARFGQILQTFNEDTEQLSYEIVSNVVDYVQANQGGLFIVNQGEGQAPQLELVASYAFQRRRFLEKKLNIGEGLVGQSFKDGDTIYITDIPDNYVDITSGLGGAQPRSVLVVPLKLSDRVYGVMELASFYEFKYYQISFLEKLGENIASNLNAAQANERTRRLLEDSNRIAERLRQQEQKMLLNLQVLEDTQKAMQKNQEALSAQSLAIKSTLLTMELNMDRSIGQANDLMLKTVKYREEELVGKPHLDLVPHTPADLALYEKLWSDLQQGIPCYGEFKRIARDGSEIWLKATYSPIKDKNGRPYKVLKLAFDVTEEKRLRLDFKEQLDSFKRSSAVVEFDLDGKIIDANDNFLDLMEYRRDEIIGREHTIIVPDDEKESRAYLALWHKLKQGRYHIGEVRRLTKTGRTVWFQGSFNPILDLNGRPYKIIEFIIDVTDRKNAEASILATKEELQQKEANLTALINNTDDAIYTIGPNYRVTLFNESARRFYESLGETLRVSSNMLELLPKNYEYVWKGYYDRALNGEKFSVEQSIFSEKTNLKFYLSIYFNPILDENEVVTGVSVFSRDISKRKQREMDIAEFTKKQAARTARIIETQKQNLQNSIERYEKEKALFSEKIAQMQVAQRETQSQLDFYAQIDTLALLVNHDYQVVVYNEKARTTFREWRFSLQTEYLLLDVFPQARFFVWKSYLDRALRGESLTFTQVLIHRVSRKPQVFAISLKPLLTEIQEVTHIFVSAQAIGDFVQHLKAHHRQYIRRLRNRYQWRIKNNEKEHQLTLEESKAYLESSRAQLQLREEIIALLEQHAEALVFRVDCEWCFTHYSHQIKHLFGRWRFCIQPEYYLPDVFPMVYFSEWMQLLRRACQGEAIQTKALVLNRAEKRFYLFRVEITPETNELGEVGHLVFKVLDQSGLLAAYRQQRKAEKHT